jgi:hypothetical protein
MTEEEKVETLEGLVLDFVGEVLASGTTENGHDLLEKMKEAGSEEFKLEMGKLLGQVKEDEGLFYIPAEAEEEPTETFCSSCGSVLSDGVCLTPNCEGL